MELLVFRFCSICSSEKKATNDDGKCDALVDGLDSNKKGNPSSRRNNSLAEFCIKAREHLLKYATVWIFPRSGKFLHSSDAAGCQLRQTRAIYVEDDEMHPKPSSSTDCPVMPVQVRRVRAKCVGGKCSTFNDSCVFKRLDKVKTGAIMCVRYDG